MHILQNLTQQASLVVQCHTYLEWRSLFCKYCQQMIHNHAFEPFREIKLKKYIFELNNIQKLLSCGLHNTTSDIHTSEEVQEFNCLAI